MKLMTNKDLKFLFRTLNARFFDNRIDKNTRVRFANAEDEFDSDDDGEYIIGDKLILIDPKMRKFYNYAAICLIHEMVHAELPEHISYPPSCHGTVFYGRIADLFSRGAYDHLL